MVPAVLVSKEQVVMMQKFFIIYFYYFTCYGIFASAALILWSVKSHVPSNCVQYFRCTYVVVWAFKVGTENIVLTNILENYPFPPDYFSFFKLKVLSHENV
jgi:hypothetical protein